MADNDTQNNTLTAICQHGGPGELEISDKQAFVVYVQTNVEKVHKALLLKASHQEMLAAEQVVLEEITTKTFRNSPVIDHALMRLYFANATTDLLQSKVEESRIQARIGIYIAMYLRHGPKLWEMINEQSPQTQMTTLKDLHLALGLIATDQGLAKVLNQQTPCDCLEKAFPNLKRVASK